MALLNQLISEKEKDENWARMNVQRIIQSVGISSITKIKDKLCYDIYNGIFDESDFDYLRKVGKLEYPAKIRFIPILSQKINFLKAEESRRPFFFRIYTTDQLSLERLEDKKLNTIFDIVRGRLYGNKMMVQKALEQVDMMKAKFEEVKNQGQAQMQSPEIQQGQLVEGQQTGQNQTMIMQPGIELQLGMTELQLSGQQLINEKEIEHIDRYYKMKYKDMLEILCHKGLTYYIQRYNLMHKFNDGFSDKLITGKEFYKVDWRPGADDPILTKVNPMSFSYSGDDDEDFIQDCEWCMEECYWTLGQIMDRIKQYNYKISDDDLTKLNSLTSYGMYGNQARGYGWNKFNTSTGDVCTSNHLYAGTDDSSSRFRVAFVYWRSPRIEKIKKSPNKYLPNLPLTHFISGDDTTPVREGDEIYEKYMTDIWEGICINDMIYIGLGKRKYQNRSVDSYGRNKLPYFGICHNNSTKRPQSLIWQAKDIQILYNIVYYHRELWIALSGVKGSYMDKSQMPEFMSQEEWQYQRKLGTAWIQTVKEGQMGPRPTFNQFQNYDDTVSPAIQYLGAILNDLEEMAANVTGVSRQRIGQITPTDPVGTTQSSIIQSSMVTEPFFYEHDLVKQKVLTEVVNMFRLAWKNGKRGSYVLGDLGREILNIMPDTLNKADYEVYIGDFTKEQRAFNEIKQIAGQQYAKGLLPLSAIAVTYNVESIKELEGLLQQYEDIAIQRENDKQRGQQESAEKISQMEQQYKAAFEKQKVEIEAAKIKIEEAKLGLLQKDSEEKGIFEQKKLDQDRYLTELDIVSRSEVEFKYLEQKAKEADQKMHTTIREQEVKGAKQVLDNQTKEKIASDKNRLEDRMNQKANIRRQK